MSDKPGKKPQQPQPQKPPRPGPQPSNESISGGRIHYLPPPSQNKAPPRPQPGKKER